MSTIGEACIVVNGGTPKTSVSEFWGGVHRWVTPAEMGNRQSPHISETQRGLTDSGLSNCSASLLPRESVILSSRAPIGHLVINAVPMAFNQGCKGLVPSDELRASFLYYFLLSSVKHLNSLGTGATFKELSATNLKRVQIPLPPLPEQDRIVAVLDEAFDAIAKATANTEKHLANARELFESVRSCSLSRATTSWERRALGEICENLDRLRVPITQSKRVRGDVPYFGASGVVDHVDEHLFDEDLLLVSEDGANLLARTYPIAFSIHGKSWVNNHAHVLRFSTDAQREFLEHYLNSIPLDEWVSGMAQPKLNQKALNSIPVPWTDDEASFLSLTAALSEVSKATTELAAQTTLKLDLLGGLKQSILQEAFSGELTAVYREMSDAGI